MGGKIVTNENAIMPANKELLESSDYADLRIRIDKYEFLAHRNIMCPRSQYIKELVDKGKLRSSNILQLPNVDAVAFEKLLWFVYTGSYDDMYVLKIGRLFHEDQSIVATEEQMNDSSASDASQKSNLLDMSIPETLLEKQIRIIHLNVRIQAVANPLQIPDLFQEANARCNARLDDRKLFENESPAFAHLLYEILTMDSSTSIDIQAEVVRVCAKYQTLLKKWPRLERIVVTFASLAWKVSKDSRLREETSNKKLFELGSKISTLQIRVRETEAEKETIRKNKDLEIVNVKREQAKAQGSNAQEISRLKTQIATLNRTIKTTETQRRVEKESYENQIQSLKAELKVSQCQMNGTSKADKAFRFLKSAESCVCRHCSEPFDNEQWLDWTDQEQPILRCGYCRTRHY